MSVLHKGVIYDKEPLQEFELGGINISGGALIPFALNVLGTILGLYVYRPVLKHGSKVDDDLTKIVTARLCSDFTFVNVLPNYLAQSSLLVGT